MAEPAPGALIGRGRRGFPWAGLLGLAGALLASGCETVGYYTQAARGQLGVLAARRPLEQVLEDPGTPQALRDRLAYAGAARTFAVRELGLPDNGSYRSYADLGRRYAAWSVMATPELSLTPRTWCFPVAGCVAYRGYFDEAAAQRFAETLRARGDDVHVGGVPAYSTLGWFEDPLPSSVLGWPAAEIAGLIFHELAHQRVYVRDDTAFNEAFAVTVEQEGVRRWLAARAEPDALAHYQRVRREQSELLGLVLAARGRLAALYGSARTIAEKRAGKAEILDELLQRCRELAAAAPGGSRYPSWSAARANNARLMAVATYHELVPGFRALLEAHGGDLRA